MYSENSDNSTDKGGSLPLANYIYLFSERSERSN